MGGAQAGAASLAITPALCSQAHLNLRGESPRRLGAPARRPCPFERSSGSSRRGASAGCPHIFPLPAHTFKPPPLATSRPCCRPQSFRNVISCSFQAPGGLGWSSTPNGARQHGAVRDAKRGGGGLTPHSAEPRAPFRPLPEHPSAYGGASRPGESQRRDGRCLSSCVPYRPSPSPSFPQTSLPAMMKVVLLVALLLAAQSCRRDWGAGAWWVAGLRR